MGWITGISSILKVVYELVKLAMSGWAAAKEMKRKAREEKALEGLRSGDSIALEEAMGSPNAGVPSGLPGAQLRPRDPPPNP